jgi:N-acetylglutamate synthase-like GNAT family acetyltransferase
MKIHENNPSHLESFINLNEEWIKKYFAIEEVDRQLASNPSAIIDSGGYIFSLTVKNKVVGVCALFNEGSGVFELARMAVAPSYQGQGFGNALIEACIAKINLVNASTVYLVSNTKLKAAISLYKKFGFVTTNIGQHPIYSRANIIMELKK